MLDNYSVKFADALFGRFPEWREMATSQHAGEENEYLYLRIARPIEDDAVGGLTISTENEEVTIKCGRHWHGHFDRDPSDQSFSEVLDLVAEILDERQVFVRFQHEESVIGGKMMDAAAARALIESGPEPKPLHPRSGVVPNIASLWSWRGTFDTTVKR